MSIVIHNLMADLRQLPGCVHLRRLRLCSLQFAMARIVHVLHQRADPGEHFRGARLMRCGPRERIVDQLLLMMGLLLNDGTGGSVQLKHLCGH